MSQREKPYGRIAYEAYCESSGNKSLISGDIRPEWGQLPDRVSMAWITAASAVITENVDRLKEMGIGPDDNDEWPEGLDES